VSYEHIAVITKIFFDDDIIPSLDRFVKSFVYCF
jgi:hypothetical protein